MAEQVKLSAKQMQQLEQFAPSHAALVKRMIRQDRRAVASPPAEVEAPAATDQVDELVLDLSSFLDRLTAGDLEDMERMSGVPALSMAVFGGNDRSVGGICALIWVLRRKDQPTYTYQDARAIPLPVLFEAFAKFDPERAANLGDLAELEEGGESAGPKADAAATFPSA